MKTYGSTFAKHLSLPAAADTRMKLRAQKKDFARKAAESQSKRIAFLLCHSAALREKEFLRRRQANEG